MQVLSLRHVVVLTDQEDLVQQIIGCPDFVRVIFELL